ncbi:MAG: glycosyltransferase family 39 protein [Holophagales bacterium]|jgi:4-amino-4-deoxy-L-arabinose transferase-like glycosyltransferase|nr:glycosyltransferase family 39 protein [Holophagales bacterium]
MTIKERWQFFLTWFALGVLPLLLRPLWQPDEGRYAEIPREMLASGDWLTPHLNGVLYFEKPPFQYWLSAISMKLFGESASAARLPLALSAFLTMYAVWHLAKRLGSDRPVWASFVAVSCLLLYACGQILTLDALFSSLCVFSVTALIEAVGLRYSGTSNSKAVIRWTLAAFVSAGCALLTKGPVVIVLLGGAVLLSLYFVRSDAKLRSSLLTTIFSPYGWLVFAVITVPWFVMVNSANPGHAHFFFYTEHFERFTTHKHARQGSNNPILDKLYFVPIILLGVLPWLNACFIGAKRAILFLRGSKGPSTPQASLSRWTIALLLAAFLWPVLFFSASGSKLIPYVMPSIVPLIAIVVAFERDNDGFLPFKRAGIEMLSLGFVFLAVALTALLSMKTGSSPAKWVTDIQSSNGGLWILILGLGFTLIGIWGIRGTGLTAPRWMVWHGALLIILTITAQQVNGARGSIDRLIAKVPGDLKGKIQWISHGSYFQSLPFLVKNRVVVVGGTGELQYGKERITEPERWFIEDRQALTEVGRRLQAERPDMPVWALSEIKAWNNLPSEMKRPWDVIDASPKAVLLRLRTVE